MTKLLNILYAIFSLSVPFYAIADGFITDSITVSVALVFFPILVIYRGHFFLRKKNLVISALFLLYFICITLSGVLNNVPDAQTGITLLFTRFVFFISPILFITNIKNYIFSIRLLYLQGVIVSLGFILIEYELLEATRVHTGRYGILDIRTPGILGNFADIAILSISILLITLYRKHFISGLWTLLIPITSLIILFTSFYYTQSRNIIVSTFLTLTIYIWYELSDISNIYFQVALKALATIIMFLFLIFSFEGFISANIFEDSGRSKQYETAFDGFLKSPIIGNGIGSFQYKYGYFWDIHNLFLNSAFNGGLLALFAIILLLYSIYQQISKSDSNNKLRRFSLIVFLGTVLASQFYPAYSSIFFWYFLGLSISIRNVSLNQTAKNVIG